MLVTEDSVTVEWQGTGPFPDSQSILFMCSLDDGPFTQCECQGFMHTVLHASVCYKCGCSTIMTICQSHVIPSTIHYKCMYNFNTGLSLEGYESSGLTEGTHFLIIRLAPITGCNFEIV